MSLMMKAIVATGKGGSNVLKLQDVPVNWPAGSRDVLVRLRAAAVNPADVFSGGWAAMSSGRAPSFSAMTAPE